MMTMGYYYLKIDNMKKVIRLTESDLILLVKRVINEGLHDIYSYLNTETFNKLPYDYKKSLMIVRNDGVGNDYEIIN